MIIQQTDSLGRIVIDGVGFIMKGTEKSPIHVTYADGKKRIAFSIITGSMKSKETDKWTNQIIPCCIFDNNKNKKIYAIAETLQPGERVAFKGHISTYNTTSKATGELIRCDAVILEWLMPERCIEPSSVKKGDKQNFFPADSEDYMF